MTEIVTPEGEIVREARAAAMSVLGQSPVFAGLSLSDQESIYLDEVQKGVARRMQDRGLTTQQSLAVPMATDTGKQMGFKGYDPSFDKSVDAFEDLVDSVDFPSFVGDLLKAVFNANLKVMKEQTDSYIKLMKECTKSTADFIKNIKDDESFAKLAEDKGDQYNVTTEKGADGSMKLALTNPQGDKLDTEDTAVKKAILEAKINMAKEHRAALREVLLMGVTRLVVEKGTIEAGVEFMITANRKSTASHQDQNINTVAFSGSYDPPLFGLLGGPSGSLNVSNTNIQINTSQKDATDTLSAKLTGKVNIQFKTDYFKLDNFANMYADGGTKAIQPAAGGAPGAPAAPGR